MHTWNAIRHHDKIGVAQNTEKPSQNRPGEGDSPRFCSADQPSVGARAKRGTVPATADVPPGGFVRASDNETHLDHPRHSWIIRKKH